MKTRIQEDLKTRKQEDKYINIKNNNDYEEEVSLDDGRHPDLRRNDS